MPPLMFALALACAPPTPPTTAPSLDVVTTSLPADWLVAQLTQDLPVSRRLIVPAGEDPPAWRPTGEVIAGLQGAGLIVANGAGYERWMRSASLPQSRTIESAADVTPLYLAPSEHEHGGQGSHAHAGLDPHTFTDPLAYGTQLNTVARALSHSLPEHAETIEGRRAMLHAALGSLADDLAAAAHPLHAHSVATSHPSFHHLARRVQLPLVDVPLAPGRAPSPQEVSAVDAWVTVAASPLLIWESPPSAAAKAALPANVHSLVLDPLEQPSASGAYDYLAQARSNVNAIAEFTASHGTRHGAAGALPAPPHAENQTPPP